MMKKNHLDVEVISSGNKVIERIKNIKTEEDSRPDIILLDLVLPDVGGLEIFT